MTRPTVWRRLGNHDTVSDDNYGWVNALGDLPFMRETEYWVFPDESCESMPYGHHQIGVFHP